MTERFSLDCGALVLTERSTVLPVVSVGVSLYTGSLFDPPGKEGLTRLLVRAMRMGTQALSSRALEEKLDSMGAQLSMSSSQSYVHFGGVVVTHNLAAFIELLSSLILRPALRPADISNVRREMLAELVALCDDDRSLCSRNFRRYAFGDHPYGRPRSGTKASLRALTHADVLAHHRRIVTADNTVIGVSGDFPKAELRRLLAHAFDKLSTRKAPTMEIAEPRLLPGRRILLVDKPERTQTQILIGTMGTDPHDNDHVPLLVANTVFGGLFSSRLNNEVRSRRGLSYGASSGFTLCRTRDLWAMHTFPAATDARSCIALQLHLYDSWVARGISKRELSAAQRYLEKSQAFEVDTAAKRLDQAIDVELFGWHKRYHSHFLARVKRVQPSAIERALRRRLSRTDQVIALVATADQLLADLEKLPDVSRIDVVPFDAI